MTEQVPWAWLLRREVVLLILVVGVVLPLGLRRSMRSLGWVSVMGAVSMATLLVSLAWLSVAAVSQGSAYPPRWGPGGQRERESVDGCWEGLERYPDC